MITQALLHFPGIGPARLAKLHDQGIHCWQELVHRADSLPARLRAGLVAEAARCEAALAEDNIAYLANALHAKDKWRVLTHYLDHVTFFDIETSGLDHDAEITVIACLHRGQMHTFVEHENLDDFLELLEDVRLLASFNGNTFDVPRVLDAFHIPRLPCPHLDLRWLCYHRGLHGGLKQIAGRLGIDRPTDLHDADGALAVHLWMRWQFFEDQQARNALLRYCASDTALLWLLALNLAGDLRESHIRAAWELIPYPATPQPLLMPSEDEAATSVASAIIPAEFGPGSPRQLRARRS